MKICWRFKIESYIPGKLNYKHNSLRTKKKKRGKAGCVTTHNEEDEEKEREKPGS